MERWRYCFLVFFFFHARHEQASRFPLSSFNRASDQAANECYKSRNDIRMPRKNRHGQRHECNEMRGEPSSSITRLPACLFLTLPRVTAGHIGPQQIYSKAFGAGGGNRNGATQGFLLHFCCCCCCSSHLTGAQREGLFLSFFLQCGKRYQAAHGEPRMA